MVIWRGISALIRVMFRSFMLPDISAAMRSGLYCGNLLIIGVSVGGASRLMSSMPISAPRFMETGACTVSNPMVASREMDDDGVVTMKLCAYMAVESMAKVPARSRAMPQRSLAEIRFTGMVIADPRFKNESTSIFISEASIYDGSKCSDGTAPCVA